MKTSRVRSLIKKKNYSMLCCNTFSTLDRKASDEKVFLKSEDLTGVDSYMTVKEKRLHQTFTKVIPD